MPAQTCRSRLAGKVDCLPLPGDGLPVGLMLVVRNGQDHRLFRMAAAVERLLAR